MSFVCHGLGLGEFWGKDGVAAAHAHGGGDTLSGPSARDWGSATQLAIYTPCKHITLSIDSGFRVREREEIDEQTSFGAREK